MTKPLNIVIDDENCYFAAGLRHSIMQYAQANKKAVCFLTSCGEAQPDVVIASARRRAQRWRRTGFNEALTPIVTIKERCFAASKAQWVLYRTDDCQRLFELLGETLESGHYAGQPERRSLTCRERQVVNYMRRGLDQSQAARVMGVSVKTVHSHKRSIMSKLMLKRNHDFIYWLLSYGGEYS
ncbi:LuxR-family transcriptional regulator [Serratia marcescens subsp. marcescens Db11]|uniref:LuxR-family transcriptional regulator n=1 Tax=Serratia marcescens subsp. marcescens Db11 TaxID=273526 RepID=A0ABC9IQL2_SERMA|nr:LuxR C-terminal-related transcriptional regulator [Serratia marcescens]CDG15007.1 LuxR-family transcriptional regulator [Serratia marcescens subsp. marcescens Db11]